MPVTGRSQAVGEAGISTLHYEFHKTVKSWNSTNNLIILKVKWRMTTMHETTTVENQSSGSR